MSSAQRAATAVVLTIVMVAAVVVGAGVSYIRGVAMAAAICDTTTLADLASDAKKLGNVSRHRIAAQAAAVCNGALDEWESYFGSDYTPSVDLTVDPSTEPSVEPSESPADNDVPADSCEVYFFANEPVVDDRWYNSFSGDPIARHPDFAGKAMTELTVEEALLEGEHRRSLDPMLTLEDAIEFGLVDDIHNDQLRLDAISRLADNCDEWRELNGEIKRVMREDYTHEIKCYESGARYSATYAVSGEIPLPMTDDVARDEEFCALVSTRKSDGRKVIRRLDCGFQVYRLTPVVTSEDAPEREASAEDTPERGVAMPPSPPGTTRNDEGVPEVEEPSDRPTPTPSPTTPGSTPTPTPSTTPSATPTPTPEPSDTPSPTPTPTPTPSESEPEPEPSESEPDEAKDPEDDVLVNEDIPDQIRGTAPPVDEDDFQPTAPPAPPASPTSPAPPPPAPPADATPVPDREETTIPSAPPEPEPTEVANPCAADPDLPICD